MSKRMGWVLVLSAACLVGQDKTDTDAVRAAIHALNERNWRSATITAEPKALAVFEGLLRRSNPTYRIRPDVGRPVVIAGQHGMFGGAPVRIQAPAIELENPRVVAGAVEFVSEDVATAEASLVRWSGTTKQATPLFFVLKKDAGVWKIAELRVLGPDPQLLAGR